MALTDKLTNIADAIREKTGSTRTMNLEGMANAINAIQTGGGGTTDHSKLENRDAADQHPISAITGLEEALTPLVGTTQTITPSQVLAAIKAGRDIALQYTDSNFGTFVFSAFNANEQQGIVVSNSILPDADGLTGTLVGIVESGAWNFRATNTATKADVGIAVNEALAAAKESGEFDGADGLTPTIGDNGNWYLGNTDTGKPSRGDKGDKGDKGSGGKSAYQYAQDGGYTGTEAEFATKLAQEKFASPNALTFTGAVEGSYDGSAPVTVKIPSGGSGGSDAWNLIEHITAEDAAISYEIPLQPGAKEYGIYWIYTNDALPQRDIQVDASLAEWGVMYRCGTNENLFLRVFKGPSNILVTGQNIAYSAHRFSSGGTHIGSGTDFPAMTLKTNTACTTSEIWVYWR